MQLTFTVDGVVELSRNLRLASDGMENLVPIFHTDAIDIVKQRSDDIFDGKGQNIQNGPAWKPLSPTTLKMREKRSGYYKKSPTSNPSTLRWTGNLQKSAVKKSDDNEGSLTYTADYAIKHHRGTGGVPRRKIIDLDADTNTKLVKALQTLIRKNNGIFQR